jgi:hypothetical protein
MHTEFTDFELKNNSQTYVQHWDSCSQCAGGELCKGHELKPQLEGCNTWNWRFLSEASPLLSTNSNCCITSYTTINYNPHISVLHTRQKEDLGSHSSEDLSVGLPTSPHILTTQKTNTDIRKSYDSVFHKFKTIHFVRKGGQQNRNLDTFFKQRRIIIIISWL